MTKVTLALLVAKAIKVSLVAKVILALMVAEATLDLQVPKAIKAYKALLAHKGTRV